MYHRSKFVTNSSSTSFVAFGVELDSLAEGLLRELPEGVYYTLGGYDCIYIHIGFPRIDVDEEGNLSLPDQEQFKQKYQTLKNWLALKGIKQKMGWIDDIVED